MAEFFGFEINRKSKAPKERPSFVPDTEADGAGVISTSGHFGVYLDIDGDKAKGEKDLILKYRDIAAQPECDAAIEDIVNETIIGDHDEAPCDIILDKWVKGDYTKYSPEAPVKILEQKEVKYNLGGAANVAANLREFEPKLCCNSRYGSPC